MINLGIQAFAGKRVLLLQGPVGPFFARLAKDLRSVGAQVYKVNFNAGDWFFYPRGAFNYRGTMEEWPAWFEALTRQLNIDVVLLFGDCRPIHRIVHAVDGLEIGVFEEGYVRPDYITLERFGVNGYSQQPREPDYYLAKPPSVPKSLSVGKTYWAMAWCCIGYFGIGSLGKPWFRHYQHHRPLKMDVMPWARSLWRKLKYYWKERGTQEQLTTEWDSRYFLVPLQVFNDAQITEHAELGGIEYFIEKTLRSFARYAPVDSMLVFKHHPMDRGYRDYAALIAKLAREESISRRVHYIHDQHLPTLLHHARGVVVVNSTVGLSALFHNAPTKVCGNALYDIPGLTYQGTLDEFWHAAPGAKPHRGLFLRFRDHLVSKTQLNGNFYKPIKLPGSCAGLVWGGPPKKPAVQGRNPADETGKHVVAGLRLRVQGRMDEPKTAKILFSHAQQGRSGRSAHPGRGPLDG